METFQQQLILYYLKTGFSALLCQIPNQTLYYSCIISLCDQKQAWKNRLLLLLLLDLNFKAAPLNVRDYCSLKNEYARAYFMICYRLSISSTNV